MNETLIICIGNLGRGDDGVAHHVASLIEESLPASVELLTCHQLDIAMVHDLSEARSVVFVDAAQRNEPLSETFDLSPAARVPGGHAPDPEGLLGMAHHLYGHAPRAWLVACAAPEMPHSEGLSPTAKAASIEAASTVIQLIGSTDQPV
ncbi:MAG: hydrogenase maturation protease [Actinomycetota bacterium]|jgi:hydrogenase maturation protease|nr:hydrogenase maturation protease [Actinomycetota bacterium]